MIAPSRSKPATPSKPRARQGFQIKYPEAIHTSTSAPETVEQFLARGGQVERLDWGVHSGSASRTMREIGNATWKQTVDRKQAQRER